MGVVSVELLVLVEDKVETTVLDRPLDIVPVGVVTVMDWTG